MPRELLPESNPNPSLLSEAAEDLVVGVVAPLEDFKEVRSRWILEFEEEGEITNLVYPLGRMNFPLYE